MGEIQSFLPPPDPQLEAHARKLYSLRPNSRIVLRYPAKYSIWKPTAGMCHQNCDEWERLYTGDTAVRGWLCFDFSAQGFFRFASHSIIRTQFHTLIDITPVNTGALRPFLEDFTPKLIYDQFITDLHTRHGFTLLDHKI